MKKKGFTLIELLAVIVILAVIAVIAVPTITNIISKASKSAFENSVNGIVKAGEYYYNNQLLKEDGMSETKIFTFPNESEELEIKGSKPTGGTVKVSKTGKVLIAVTNGKYCARKGYGEEKIIIDENVSECTKTMVYKDSEVNGADPELKDGMIPIVIDSTTGIATVADIYNETTPWYEYGQKKWANVVTVTEASRANYINNDGTYKSGIEISEGDILTYLTWIPRYKYKLWNVDNFATTGVDASKVHSIEIVFESKNTNKSNGSTNGSYLTHPAFTFGSDEVNGMWVGKFETGYSGAAPGNVTASEKVVIKPNMTDSDIRSWRGIQVANAFYTVLGMNVNETEETDKNIFGFNKEEIDTHMMKNSEWGAVAYLSHSKYGINYEVRLNNNSEYRTGCGALEENKEAISTCENQYGTVSSYPQSTTGNITGVFDMAGGSWEYVMGVAADSSGKMYSGRNNQYNSGFVGKLGYPNDGTDTTKTEVVAATEGLAENQIGGGKTVPDSKYYDLYPYHTLGAAGWSKRILGDATGELGPFNTSGNYTSSWYGDYAGFVYSGVPWFLRGGGYSNTTFAGAFFFNSTYYAGGASSYGSFRVVVIDK